MFLILTEKRTEKVSLLDVVVIAAVVVVMIEINGFGRKLFTVNLLLSEISHTHTLTIAIYKALKNVAKFHCHF